MGAYMGLFRLCVTSFNSVNETQIENYAGEYKDANEHTLSICLSLNLS